MNDEVTVIDPELVTASVQILTIHDETALDRTFHLKWDGQAQAGQFFMVGLPGVGEAPISVSVCEDGQLLLTMRNVGVVTKALFALHPGETFSLRGPYGHGWPEEKIAKGRVIIAAGGSGVVPVRGLIRRLIAQGVSLEILLGFRSPQDILFREEIAQWAHSAKVSVTVDKPDATWTGHSGVITTLVSQVDPGQEPRSILVVGPPIMMKFTIKALLDRGFAPEDILVSYERRMSCGLGRCGHCRIHDAYVCLDGPVMPYIHARRLHD